MRRLTRPHPAADWPAPMHAPDLLHDLPAHHPHLRLLLRHELPGLVSFEYRQPAFASARLRSGLKAAPQEKLSGCVRLLPQRRKYQVVYTYDGAYQSGGMVRVQLGERTFILSLSAAA